jgi:hypothetical protein
MDEACRRTLGHISSESSKKGSLGAGVGLPTSAGPAGLNATATSESTTKDFWTKETSYCEKVKPRVLIIGGKDDYVEYQLSANLLSRFFGEAYWTEPLTVSFGWSDEQWIVREPQPAVIIIHASAFSEEGKEDAAVNKFQANLSDWYSELKQTKFIVFSSYPPSMDAGKCRRWAKQVAFLTDKKFSADRLAFYPLPQADKDLSSSVSGQGIQRVAHCYAGPSDPDGCAAAMKQVAEAQDRMPRQSCDATAP